MKSVSGQKAPQQQAIKNPLESLRDIGYDAAKTAGSSLGDLGTGIFDQLLGVDSSESKYKPEGIQHKQEKKPSYMPRREFKTIWSIQQEQENRAIRQLLEQIKREIKMLRQADAALLREVKDIDNLTIDLPEGISGIYHVRFLELVISILKTIRLKVNESRTWLAAFKGKSNKKGFKALSKKKGTSFSMSQEHAVSRSVQ